MMAKIAQNFEDGIFDNSIKILDNFFIKYFLLNLNLSL